MNRQRIPLKVTGARLVRVVRIFLNSEAGRTAKWMFAALVALLIAANGLNVVNSYVNRNFMTAIADRNMAGFIRLAIYSVGVFAASTVVAVIAHFAEERLGLLWREALTRQVVRHYLAEGTYERLAASDELANPDQRIAEDVRAFTVTALSFILMALNGALAILARLAYEDLTLSSTNGAPLVKDLSISVPLPTRVRVAGPNPAAGTALFKATGGLSIAGAGRILRPADMHFLAERPYLPPGTLRQALAPAGSEGEPLDEQITELLRALKVEAAVAQAGGLDSEQDWNKVLSLRDQQLLAFARLILASPRLAFLDRIFGALGPDLVGTILRMMAERSIAYIDHEQADASSEHYDAVLECSESGEWTWRANAGGPAAADAHADESLSEGEGEQSG